MTVVDQQHRQHEVDPALEERVRRELAGAPWFRLAAATSRAHHEYDEALRRHDEAAAQLARDRHTVLERLLADEAAHRHHG
ncbi:hypothetical protein [Cellulomonas sp. P5_C6]